MLARDSDFEPDNAMMSHGHGASASVIMRQPAAQRCRGGGQMTWCESDLTRTVMSRRASDSAAMTV